MPARGGEEVLIDDFNTGSKAPSRVPARFRNRVPGERPARGAPAAPSAGGRGRGPAPCPRPRPARRCAEDADQSPDQRSRGRGSDDGHDRSPRGGSTSFRMGEAIEAKFKGGSAYFKGKIERAVAGHKIRKPGGRSPARGASSGDRLREGDKVEARYRGREKYYPGKIARDRMDGTFDVDYDDGEKETRVEERLIRKKDGGGGGDAFREGQKVEAKYRAAKETRVAARLIRERDGGGARSPARGASSSSDKLREGDKVEARYRGREKYYAGKISRDRGDGTYDIDYDDGEKETRVEARLIKKKDGGGGGGGRGDSFREGEKIEARYRGREKYYPGRISRDRFDGTYDIDYDDGEKETRVEARLIRSKDGGGARSPSRGSSSSDKLREGDKVEARYRGREKYYPGKISRDRGDGTFDIDYDDGEKETRVEERLIRKKDGGGGGGGLREGAKVEARYRGREKGDKVEARYRGKERYYPGKILRDRGDDTFDVEYDDGETETRVKASYIRSKDGGGGGGGGGKLREGDKVEARYRGREKYYPGKIARDRGDGTFDINYDDGERETRVEERLIRAKDGGGGSSDKIREGDKVEARYRGREKYYPAKSRATAATAPSISTTTMASARRASRSASSARRTAAAAAAAIASARARRSRRATAKERYHPGKIRRDRGDDTYDIDYDDGETETRVKASYIRSKDGGGARSPSRGSSSSDKLREGDKVEARYRGREKYYPGRIERDRGDGTYDVYYDDGEKETRVEERLIRKKDGGGGGGGKLREGDKVEARYRGREKYYPGKITRDRGDGTFDIAYDDGERETRVEERLIRSKDGGGSSGGDKLREGEKVEARYRGREKYYPGRIERDRGDGTYDIYYDDGEKETRVEERLIRKKDAGGGSGGGKLREGDKVEARYRGREKYYPGKITRDRGDGTFDIDYDDGERETRVEERLIRAKDGGGGGGGGLREGAKVEARYRGREKYYPGKITRDRGDGTFDIDHDDGERETRVEERLIRAKDGGGGGGDSFREGEKVEARYRGKERYHPGKIRRDRGDDTYDIDYDDGETETRVKASYIRSKDGGGGGGGDKLREGDKVEARYRGREKYYPGRIERDRGDGTYDIYYDDGEKETRVEERLIRKKDAGGGGGGGKLREGDKIARDRGDGTFDINYDDGERETRVEERLIRAKDGGGGSSDKIREGDKVEARYRGREKYYPGKITRDRGDGTFDIDYDDGERETRVEERLIRKKDGGGGGGDSFREGEKVEARYRGKERYYPGEIRRDRGDDTYDIDYDDGETETRVKASYIRSKDGGGSSSSDKLREGDKVEARYRGREKYYPGRIERDRGDGTYDVYYDDGEKETRVEERLIRKKDAGGGGGGKLREGDKVEARYRGREKYYPGKITRDRGDGTFDIAYDDGERETRVEERLIRAKDGGSSSDKIREGDKVEARYRGREKYYPGKISRDRGDGTFDIDYDDGEKETRVEERLIRKKDGGGGGDKLREGDKIEARYRGREKYYPGKISRDRGDGTYDIDYDDGERETRVEERLIRSKDGGGGGDKLREGDKVEARYRGREKYYPGKISRDRGDGTFDIDYDDGEKETRVEERLIKKKDGGGGGGKLREGDKVEARYRGREKYYPGKIGRDRGDGTYDIDYDDGEKETRVEERLIRPKEGGGGGDKFEVGDKVEARYRGREKYNPGKIGRCHSDGTYDIDYDDGEQEKRVEGRLVKAREAKRSPRRDSARRRSPSPPARRSRSPRADRERARERSRSRSPGDRVAARFRGREKYYPGKIRTDRGDGTYDVSYDDGATETRVREDLVRAASRRDADDDSRDGGADKLRSGDKCEARYRGRDKWYPGVVGRANVDGSYDVDYDDGEREAPPTAATPARRRRRGRRSPARSDDRRGDDDENERLKRRLRDLEDKLAGDRWLARRDDAAGPPWHAMVNQDDDVIDELVGAIGTGHGSVGQWLNTSATPLEKRNFIEFVQTLEEFEGRRGLTPQNRSADDISGTIHLTLGPTIRCQLKFLV
ncbi:tudor domain-containing protein [Aureococcus anophagefferens]|nr:tudor domain-containing protein [Aureococcus anophagefferens]